MWLERFVIIVCSLYHDYLPSSWAFYVPTRFDISLFVGTLGQFLLFTFIFIRFIPMMPMFEIRTLLPEAKVKGHH
jgi:molybdopterin-containing oxidoreductase family membrane subunit